MKITPRNILKHELIGLPVEVVECTNSSLKGLRGVVAYETMKTLVIKTEKKTYKVAPKAICVFRFTLPDGVVVRVDGKYLVGRPEDRIRRRLRGW